MRACGKHKSHACLRVNKQKHLKPDWLACKHKSHAWVTAAKKAFLAGRQTEILYTKKPCDLQFAKISPNAAPRTPLQMKHGPAGL